MATAQPATNHDQIRDWEDWFAAFERNKLAFLYQDKPRSRFSRLVNR